MLKTTPVGNETTGPGTTVGVNVALSGTLKDQNDITVYGLVDGEVVSDRTVTIGKTAQVKGPVRGNVVTIAGVVRGSVDAAERLEILETGKVFGSTSTKNLVIHSGATFVGKSTMPSEVGADEEGEMPEGEDQREEAKAGNEPASEANLQPEEE